MRRVGRISSERIREARLYRKKTMEELAQQVGINKQAISQFENDKASPEPTTLKRIADALNFPYSFFSEDDNESLIGNTYFRALYSSRKKDLVSQQIKSKYLAKIYTILSKRVKFRPLNLPRFVNDESYSIEEVASRTRQYWELGEGPISNMVSILERNGVVVGEFSTEIREIDAFYQFCEFDKKPTYCIVLGTDKKSFYRRQFNCAHELGHILLHECYSDLNEIDRDDFRKREDQANAFAAAFLLPPKSFGKDVSVYPNKLSYYVELKKKWYVSIMAMVMRAHSLEYLSDNQYSYLMRQMSANGYRQQEPLDDVVEYKHPHSLKQSIDLLMTKGGMTSEEILEMFSEENFSIPADVIEGLLNLERGKLSQSSESKNILYFPSLVSQDP